MSFIWNFQNKISHIPINYIDQEKKIIERKGKNLIDEKEH